MEKRRETEKTPNEGVWKRYIIIFFIIFDYNIQIFWQLDINEDIEDDDDDIFKDLFIDDAEFIS